MVALTPKILHQLFPKNIGEILAKIRQIDATSLTAENLFNGTLTMGLSNRSIEANSSAIKLMGKFRVTSTENATSPSKPPMDCAIQSKRRLAEVGLISPNVFL
jgi:hypothetical protein